MPHTESISAQMIMDDLTRVFSHPDVPRTSVRYRAMGGQYSLDTIFRRFGSWGKAMWTWEHGWVTTEERTKEKKRECLRCEKVFPSSGPENRLCPGCREFIGTETFAREYAYSAGRVREVGW